MPSVPASPSPAPASLIFELEGLAVRGIPARFDVLQSLLGDQGFRLGAGTFARHVLSHPAQPDLAGLLADLGSSLKPDTLARDLGQGMEMWLRAPDRALDPGFRGVLESLRAREWTLAAYTFLDEDLANDLAARLGLAELGVTVVPVAPSKAKFLYDDAWEAAADALGQSPTRCWGIAHDQASVQGALGAGLLVIAAPDKLTAFQDYSGVDAVIENLTPKAVEELFAAVGA